MVIRRGIRWLWRYPANQASISVVTGNATLKRDMDRMTGGSANPAYVFIESLPDRASPIARSHYMDKPILDPDRFPSLDDTPQIIEAFEIIIGKREAPEGMRSTS